MNNVIKRFLGAVLGLLIGLASSAAFAFDPYPNFTFSPGAAQTVTGTVVRGGAGGSFSVSSSGATFTQAAETLPFKPATSLNLRAVFSPSNIARGMVRGAVVALILTTAMNQAMNAACVRGFGGTTTLAPGGQWEECHFTSSTVEQFIAVGDGASTSTDRQQSCNLGMQHGLNRGYIQGNYAVLSPYSGDPYQVICTVYNSSGAYWTSFAVQQYGTATVTAQDGWVAVPASDVESKVSDTLAQWANAGDPRVGTVVQDMWNQGQPTDGTLQPPTVQTPVNEPAQTTTQTGSDGKTTTTTDQTKDDYSCQVISNGQALTCTQYQTKTTTTSTVDNSNPNSTPTTSTTVVNKTGDPSQQDPCNTDPNRAGCADLGVPPTPETIPSNQVPVTWTNVVFASPAGCPAALPYTMFGKSYSLPFDPMCNLMTTLRPLFLALGAAAAAYVFMEGLKS